MLLCLAALLLYLFALFAWHKRQNLLCLASILGGGLLLRFFCALDPLPHDWDECYHALVAKNLMDAPLRPMLYKNPILPFDFRAWGSNHVWLHKQPLPLWAMAFSMKIFGVSVLAMRLPALLLSTISIALTFSIGQKMFGERSGLLAAFFQSVNGFVLEIGAGRVATDHIDLFFMFFVQLSVWLALLHREHPKRRWLLLCGLACGGSILCKWLPGLVVLPVLGLFRGPVFARRSPGRACSSQQRWPFFYPGRCTPPDNSRRNIGGKWPITLDILPKCSMDKAEPGGTFSTRPASIATN